MKFLDHPYLVFIVGVLSIPAYLALAKMFWGNKYESLGEAFRALLDPTYGFRAGKVWANWDAEIKFFCFVTLCLIWVAAITEIIARYLP